MRFSRLLSIISLSVLAIIGSFSAVIVIPDRPPKAAKIVGHFRAHRAAYERLRMMLPEDKEVGDVATWGIARKGTLDWKVPPDGGMSVGRYYEYLALIRQNPQRAEGYEPHESLPG